jgi:SPOR domain
MIIGTQLRNRGTTAFYRVRVPADSRTAADTLCNRIRSAGGACVVLRNSPATSSEERLLPTAIR